MRITWFQENGVQKVMIHIDQRIGIVFTQQEFDQRMKIGLPLGEEVSRLLKNIRNTPRITHVIQGGK